MLVLYWVYIGVVSGIYGDNEKENGKYYVGCRFRVGAVGLPKPFHDKFETWNLLG